MPYSATWRRMFSSADRWRSIVGFWKMIPMLRRTALASRSRSCPSIVTSMQADVYAPHLHAHEHLDDAHHQQLHDAMDRLQEPVIRCFELAGPPDPALSPRAAVELLSGILF